MKVAAALASAVVASMLATTSPAIADLADPPSLPHGYSQTTICVTYARAPATRRVGAFRVWNIRPAVRAWNSAQDHVYLSLETVPGCDVLEVGEFAGPEFPDWNGYADWPDGAWDDPVRQRISYDLAQVWLNHAKLVESYKPRFRGTNRKCWRKRVIVHEMGHALGLDHTTGSESVMSYEHDYQKYCGTPSESDVATIAALYTLPAG